MWDVEGQGYAFPVLVLQEPGDFSRAQTLAFFRAVLRWSLSQNGQDPHWGQVGSIILHKGHKFQLGSSTSVERSWARCSLPALSLRFLKMNIIIHI